MVAALFNKFWTRRNAEIANDWDVFETEEASGEVWIPCAVYCRVLFSPFCLLLLVNRTALLLIQIYMDRFLMLYALLPLVLLECGTRAARVRPRDWHPLPCSVHDRPLLLSHLHGTAGRADLPHTRIVTLVVLLLWESPLLERNTPVR